MDGLIEFSQTTGLNEQTDRASVEDSISGQDALRRLATLEPSRQRLTELHRVRVSARSCPMAALALASLFDATIERKPGRYSMVCRLYGLSVKFSAMRLNALTGQTSTHYEMTLRQTAVEALRRVAINALEDFDLAAATDYLDAAEVFNVPLTDYVSFWMPHPRR